MADSNSQSELPVPLGALAEFCDEVAAVLLGPELEPDTKKQIREESKQGGFTQDLSERIDQLRQSLDTVNLRLDDLESVSIEGSLKPEVLRTGKLIPALTMKVSEMESCFDKIDALERGINEVQKCIDDTESEMTRITREITKKPGSSEKTADKVRSKVSSLWRRLSSAAGSPSSALSSSSSPSSAASPASGESSSLESPASSLIVTEDRSEMSPIDIAENVAETDEVMVRLKMRMPVLFDESTLFRVDKHASLVGTPT